jgi:hypothetical protein
MSRVLTLALLVAALLGSPPVEARPVSTQFACVTACGATLTETCGGITKRGPFHVCRRRLYRQCRRWGGATMCPAPPSPTTTTLAPAASTTTTTVPVPGSLSPTTTMPSHPTTTTSRFHDDDPGSLVDRHEDQCLGTVTRNAVAG